MVDEAIDCGQRHSWIGKDVAPFAERLIGGDQDQATLVARTDQFK
jgi:hypothetical protein